METKYRISTTVILVPVQGRNVGQWTYYFFLLESSILKTTPKKARRFCGQWSECRTNEAKVKSSISISAGCLSSSVSWQLISPNSDSLQLHPGVLQMCALGRRRGLGESVGISRLPSITETEKTIYSKCSTNGAEDTPPMCTEDRVTHMHTYIHTHFTRQGSISFDGNREKWADKGDTIKTGCLPKAQSLLIS